MPSNEQRRQTAKRKLERQLARRAERAKKRRIWGVSITVVVVVAVVGVVYWIANLGPEESDAATNEDAGCGYAENPNEAPSVGLPDDPDETPKDGTVKVAVKTNQGDIPLVLDRAKAPCTVQSMEHLVKSKFFDGTNCHRLTASEGLKVLQCGDPKGDGTGGPGYTLPDELPTDLEPGPTGPDGQPTVIYPRGTIAMANGGPNTGGSQFFLVYGDSTLPASYTVFGELDEKGLAVVDKIAQGGITPGQNGPTDGSPKSAVTIESAKIS